MLHVAISPELCEYNRCKCFQFLANVLGDKCIHNFHIRDFRPNIQRYTSPNEQLEYGYPHFNALLQFRLKLEFCKPHKAARHPTKCSLFQRFMNVCIYGDHVFR